MGSPALATLTTRYCRVSFAVMAHSRSWAVALRGFAMNQAGSPVARARRPTRPVPKRAVRRAFRRVRSVVVMGVPKSNPERHRGGGLAREGEGVAERVGGASAVGDRLVVIVVEDGERLRVVW